MALKYDSYNILANYAELIFTFHDWILDPYSPLNTRRILVKINDFRSKYPGHYLFDVMSGSYILPKIMLVYRAMKLKL